MSRYDLNQIPYDYTVEVRDRFKGLDLIDRVPGDIVQETGIKTIPMEKKCKKAKWLPEEALQIAVKRREAKSKGEKDKLFFLFKPRSDECTAKQLILLKIMFSLKLCTHDCIRTMYPA